ncbi:MAG: helix-turn-helix domain-containing protein [Desulfohalobiaceae bacterium]
MDFKEIGELLRQQRQEQGWSLEEIHQKIKISPSCLRNIEQGIWDDLPHPVYVKGFIKNYAQFLGLDAERLSHEFAQALALHQEEEEEGVVAEPVLTLSSKRPKFWRMFSLLISLLLLLLLAYLVYDLFLSSPGEDRTREESVSQEQNAPDQGQVKEKQSSENAEAEASSTVQSWLEFQPILVSSGSRQEQEVAMLPEDAADRQAEAEDDGNGQEIQAQALPETEQENDQEAHVLKVSASEACWLQAVVDEDSREMFLRPGESVSFKFWEQLELKLGNAGGVELVYNDQEYPLQAESGEVMEIDFP